MTNFDLNELSESTRQIFIDLMAENERLKQRIKELTAVALHDDLTGLINRRGFLSALEKALAFSKRYKISASLIFVDLNHFKQINDTHGHAAGDVVLKTVAQRIARQVRSSDVVARLGGDEFVMLLWNVNEEIARARAGLLTHAICRDAIVLHDNTHLTIKASAGVALMQTTDTPEGILERADQAMYQRKTELKMAG